MNLPPVKAYFPPLGRYYRYVVNTMDVPPVQEIEGMTVITPQFDNLWIYGREIGSPYPEDQEGLKSLYARRRIMGEWFSVACPDGEGGSCSLDELISISEEEFSQAFERGWEAPQQ